MEPDPTNWTNMAGVGENVKLINRRLEIKLKKRKLKVGDQGRKEEQSLKRAWG